MDDTSPGVRCPRCGANLPVSGPEGLCPACLFAAAAASLATDARTSLSHLTGTPQDQAARLAPGQAFGPYRIGRLLGRGGMGDVYEAQHLDQGRCVALKVLNQRLTGVEDRARFLREGQLAAAVSHLHSVYIFGSEDIEGTPAISMELLPGGTLKDRVKEGGPLPPAEAVDAILDVIAGLDALHAVGVLHRDVKPGNCFVDRDGTVKVGDFGLSISTLARDVTQLTSVGTFLGTPQFASPEQLKGHPMDVRSDIYAVGATLYYLLTGQPPFDDTNLLALVARIAAEAPPSPRTLMPGVPRGLATIVLSCLAKDRAERPATHAALHDALQPFSSATPTPATIGLRFAAWAIDSTTLTIPWLLVNVGLTLSNLSSLTQFPPSQWWLFITQVATWIGYYGILEGVWGAAIGKRLMGLRVVIASGGRPPGVPRASVRALIFFVPSFVFLVALAFLGYERMGMAPSYSVTLLVVVATALIFSTARRRNGFAGVHELWSGTRVVQWVKETPLPSLGVTMEHGTDLNGLSCRLGPFDVVGTLGRTEVGTLLLGFDPRLRRRVWLHEVPPGVPAVEPLIRDLSRPGRLRWLGERRTSTERWDAYEALDGEPLLSLLDRPRTWRVVRHWVADLAQEISAGLSDGSLSRLALDRVWITIQGRAKLLDFQVPGAPPDWTRLAGAESAQAFLSQVAIRALTGDASGTTTVSRRFRRTLPLSATALLDALEHQRVESWSDVVRRTTALANGPERVERWRRATSLGLAAAIPAGLATMSAIGMVVAAPAVMRAITPEVQELSDLLNGLSGLGFRDQDPASLHPSRATPDRAALETYIAGRFGPMVTNPRFWSDPLTAGFLGRHRRQIERIVAERPRVSADELAAATATVGPFLKRQARLRQTAREMNPWTTALRGVPFLFALTAIVAVLSAWLFRGGLFLRALNIAVVTKNGEPISRLRALWRGLGAWGVFIVPLLIFSAVPHPGSPDPGLVVTALAQCTFGLAGAAWAVVSPERGLQDRIAGTYLVPR